MGLLTWSVMRFWSINRSTAAAGPCTRLMACRKMLQSNTTSGRDGFMAFRSSPLPRRGLGAGEEVVDLIVRHGVKPLADRLQNLIERGRIRVDQRLNVLLGRLPPRARFLPGRFEVRLIECQGR